MWIEIPNDKWCCPKYTLIRRTYGKNGESFPRITLSLYYWLKSMKVGESLPHTFDIGASYKEAPDAWWEECETPLELLGEFTKMIEEGKRKVLEMMKDKESFVNHFIEKIKSCPCEDCRLGNRPAVAINFDIDCRVKHNFSDKAYEELSKILQD